GGSSILFAQRKMLVHGAGQGRDGLATASGSRSVPLREDGQRVGLATGEVNETRVVGDGGDLACLVRDPRCVREAGRDPAPELLRMKDVEHLPRGFARERSLLDHAEGADKTVRRYPVVDALLVG